MKIYLDYDFLESFLLNEDGSEVSFRLKSLFTSRNSENVLVVNFDPIDYFNDPEKRVIVRHISSRLDIKIEINFENMNLEEEYSTLNPHSLFFINKDHADFEGFGFSCFKSEDLNKVETLLMNDDVPLNSAMKSWEFLGKYKIPANAMIITDNYLFSNDLNLENTKSILKTLLPMDLKVPFDLTIVGYDPKKSFKPLKNQYEELKVFFEKEFPLLSVNLTIIREDYHERAIYTNCTRFKTHKGFSIFKNRAVSTKEKTIVHYSPIASKTLSGYVFQGYREEIVGIAKKVRVQRMGDKEMGSKSNRLWG